MSRASFNPSPGARVAGLALRGEGCALWAILETRRTLSAECIVATAYTVDYSVRVYLSKILSSLKRRVHASVKQRVMLRVQLGWPLPRAALRLLRSLCRLVSRSDLSPCAQLCQSRQLLQCWFPNGNHTCVAPRSS